MLAWLIYALAGASCLVFRRYEVYCSWTSVAGLLRRHGCWEVLLCADVYVFLQSMLCQRRCHVTARATGGGRCSRGRQRPALGAVVEVPSAVRGGLGAICCSLAQSSLLATASSMLI